MDKKLIIEQLQNEKKELEFILTKVLLRDSDTISINDKVPQFDSLLDEMISINEKIDKMEHQPGIVFVQSIMSRFINFPGVDKKDNAKLLNGG